MLVVLSAHTAFHQRQPLAVMLLVPSGPSADFDALKKRKREAERYALLQKRVQHPRIMLHSLGGSVALSRELGCYSPTRPRDVPGSAYACGFVKGMELGALPESGNGEVVKFARDEVTGGYVLGMVACFEVGESLS